MTAIKFQEIANGLNGIFRDPSASHSARAAAAKDLKVVFGYHAPTRNESVRPGDFSALSHEELAAKIRQMVKDRADSPCWDVREGKASWLFRCNHRFTRARKSARIKDMPDIGSVARDREGEY